MDDLERVLTKAKGKKNKGWKKIDKKYPDFTRPDWYAFRPKDCPVVIRNVDSSNQTNYLAKVEETLETAGLFKALEESTKRQRIPKEDFLIGIKPNWMMALTKAEPHVVTDPKLVYAVVDILKSRGYNNTVIFESDNMYSNFIENHTVFNVLEKIVDVNIEKYNIVNLTQEVGEKETYSINTRKMGSYPIAPTLAQINFLINIPKLKSHPSAGLTLSFKNMHGANFFSDKFNFLHGNALFDLFREKSRFWFDPTFELNVNPQLEYTKDMFTIVDAEYSQDGPGGWKSSTLYFMGESLKSPFTGEPIKWGGVKRTGKIIASRDPYNLEIVTMLLTNYTPNQIKMNPFLKLMHEVVTPIPTNITIDDDGKNVLQPFPEFKTSGNFESIYISIFGKKVGKLMSWNSKIATNMIKKILTLGEGIYPAANVCGWMFSGTDKDFPIKKWHGYKKELWQHSKEDWWQRNWQDKKKLKKIIKEGKNLQEFEYGKKEVERIRRETESHHAPYASWNF